MKITTKLRPDNVLEFYKNELFIGCAIFNGDDLNRNEINKMDWHTPELRVLDSREKICLVGQTLKNLIDNPNYIESFLTK